MRSFLRILSKKLLVAYCLKGRAIIKLNFYSFGLTFFCHMNEILANNIEGILSIDISEDRIAKLQPLIDYIKSKREKGQPIRLNFICTHNSRRSQFSQIWAQTAADYFEIPAFCYSGGVEVTACNERTIHSLERSGFIISKHGHSNPIYFIYIFF
jgi:arsenate reductase